MKLVSTRNQSVRDYLYPADITLSGSAQLVLGQSQSRSCLILQNLGSHSMAIEFGSARATATISGGAVTSVAISNAGFGFTYPPVVRFLGGGNAGNGTFTGLAQPNAAAPPNFATAQAVLSGNTVGSITVNNGGSGYKVAPMVFIFNSDLDPNGCATPALNSSGLLLASGTGPLAFNGTACPTDPISVIGTNGDVLLCRWMD